MKENLEKKDVIECLESFGYFEYFNQQVLDGKSPYFDGKEIYLGNRKGYLFKKNSISRGVLVAANRYLDLYPMASNKKNDSENTDNLIKGRERIEYWRKSFESLNDEKELLVATIDILDWGNVWSSNVAEVIEIHRGRNPEIESLKTYFESISEYVKKPKLIGENDKIHVHFSSGWTKVYSFMYDSMVIYDSRVSAFLNYTLLMALKSYCEEYSSDGEKKKKAYEGFHNISSNLFNFGGSGNTGNLRKFSFNKRSNIFKPESKKTDIQGFNANVIATWIVEEIWENIPSEQKENVKYEFKDVNGIRVLERAFFLLGFDLRKFNVSLKVDYFKSIFESLERLKQYK